MKDACKINLNERRMQNFLDTLRGCKNKENMKIIKAFLIALIPLVEIHVFSSNSSIPLGIPTTFTPPPSGVFNFLLLQSLVLLREQTISHLRKSKCILVDGGSQERQPVCYIYDMIIFPVGFSSCLIPFPIPQCIAKSSNAISSITEIVIQLQR